MKTQLKKDEKVVVKTQPHWLTLVGPALVLLTTLASVLVIGVYGLAVGAVGIIYFIYKLFERKNNLWAVTNLRVIDEFGVFTNNTKESPLDKINNVSYNQTFWGKIFGFGNVQIQTAAEVGATNYQMVTNPKELKDTITHMQEEYKHLQIKKQATELANAMISQQQSTRIDPAAELEKMHELKRKGILTEEEYNSRKAKILNS